MRVIRQGGGFAPQVPLATPECISGTPKLEGCSHDALTQITVNAEQVAQRRVASGGMIDSSGPSQPATAACHMHKTSSNRSRFWEHAMIAGAHGMSQSDTCPNLQEPSIVDGDRH